ncbi:MAG: proprotein convertase P-domain-containing protein, partial [Bacteroidota bacterium]
TCIDVSGVCNQTWNTGDVLSVAINILHAWDQDLDIYLQAPNGVYYLLSQDLGGGGDNYTNTVFSATGATVIAGGAAAAPFTGTFKPLGTGNNFSGLNGTSINGTWCLWVGDDGAIDQGSIQNWSLTFANQTTFTYAWSPATGLSATNVLTPTACPTSSTSYSLTVTNECGCSTTATVPITVTTPVTPTFNPIGPICAGSVAPALPTTSTNGITGTWSPATISNVATGTYTFTPNAGQCANTASLIVTVDNAPVVTSVITNPLCLGNTNGSVDVSVSGGTAPFTYQWSNGSTNQDLSNLAVGTYTVTVSSANGCTAVLSNVVATPIAVSVSITSTTNINCFGQSTGAVSSVGNGGTSPYTYLWSTGATTNSISNLPLGVYTVTVTDANGCTNNTIVSATLLQQPQLNVSLPTVTNVSCFGGSNGSISASPSGGTAGYNYQWSNGSFSNSASGLIAGTYTVTVTDAYGCTATNSATITQPTQLTISIPSTTNVLCNGASTGSATSLASNGTAGYSYLWNTGATTATINNLTVGTYTVTATDANGCTASTNTTITQPSLLTVSIPSTTNVLCNGASTGSATSLASNGTAGYSYLWNTGSTSATINSLMAGTYT